MFYYPANCTAIDTSKVNTSVGVDYYYSLISNNSSFSKLPGIKNCCPVFDKGTGSSYKLGIFFDVPFGLGFFLKTNIFFSNTSSRLTKNENVFVALQDETVLGNFEHIIENRIKMISIQPTVTYQLFRNFKTHIGLWLGYVYHNSFIQYERITEPENSGTFINKDGTNSYSRIRNLQKGIMPNYNKVLFGLSGGVAYHMNLDKNNRFMLIPEIDFSLLLTNLVHNLDWKYSELSFGLGFSYNFIHYDVIPEYNKSQESIIRIDTIIIVDDKADSLMFCEGKTRLLLDTQKVASVYLIKELLLRVDTLYKPSVKSRIDVTIASDTTLKNKIEQIVIKEYLSLKGYPFLNCIFFERNCSELPSRYIIPSKEEIRNSHEYSIVKYETLPIYYNILKIIGYRMSTNTNSTLTINGIVSNYEYGTVARERCLTIKRYLENVFNIDSNRIHIIASKSKYLQDNVSREKQEEDQRVEMTSNDSEVFAPILQIDTLFKIEPMKVYAFPKITNYQDVSYYTFDIVLGNDTVITDTIIRLQSYYEIELSKLNFKKYKKNLTICLSCYNSDKEVITSIKETVPLEYKTINTPLSSDEGIDSYDSYCLILFDRGKTDITGQNIQNAEIIKSRISSNSEVTIIGYTDSIGEPELNKQLALERATNFARLLNLESAYIIDSKSNMPLYDNSLPEGRLYSRTVEVRIKNTLPPK